MSNKTYWIAIAILALAVGILALFFGFSQYEKNIYLGTAILVIGFGSVALSIMIIATIKLEDTKNKSKADNKYINYLFICLKKYDVSIRILSNLTLFLGVYSLIENNFLIGIILISVATPTLTILVVLLINQRFDLTAEMW